MIYIKSPEQIEEIRKLGHLTNQILVKAFQLVKEGVTTLYINNEIERMIMESGATPWFKEIDNYPYGSCIAVNADWIHGMPNSTPLSQNDLISIDIGLKRGGFYTDHCWTSYVGFDHLDHLPLQFNTDDKKRDKLLNIGINSLMLAIEEAKPGNRIGKISNTMQKVVEEAGFEVVEDYAGHGVGLAPHEDPIIPCFGVPSQGAQIKPGMVLAVESMYSEGSPKIKITEDGWTATTQDGSLTGMFEHTVAVTEKGPEILTI